ncbi:MAG: metal-dependent hydrolase [Acidobacteriia bacterium]|nr:metal-dependent hydrolase [Terriglobia bacterium]
MASAKEHMLIGAGVAAVGWMLYCKIVERPLDLGEIVLAAGVGLIGGLVPDLFEPAIHLNHRQFFHSYLAAGLLTGANHHVSQNANLRAETRTAIHLASLGFMSHLVADAQTPKGLPWA